MRADNSHHVIDAAHRRAQSTHRRAVAALRHMDNTGLPVTVDAIAREAGVSRSWLYNQPELRADIERLRNRRRPAAGRPVPDRQRSSDASLLRRVEVATQRIRDLETDNNRLRHALAEALGERRTTPSHQPHRDTPRPQISTVTRPSRTATSPTPSTTQTHSSQQ